MSFFMPPPDGFHEAERNPDGTLKGRIDPVETKRRDERRKSAMDSYFAKSAEAQERLRRSAAGITEKPETPAPKDELGLIEMNFLADPGLLQGKGAVPLQVLTEAQQRSRRRADLDAKAAEARKDLNTYLKGDDEDPDNSWASVTDEELETILDRNDDWDDTSWLTESEES